MLIVLGAPAFAIPVTEAGSVRTIAENKSLWEAFVDTRIEGRIVKLKVRKYKNKKSKVTVIWHPRNRGDILEDMLIILETVNKVVPNFSSVSLRAIHPDYMRWSKYVLWEALVTKKAFILLQGNQLDKFDDYDPQPLF